MAAVGTLARRVALALVVLSGCGGNPPQERTAAPPIVAQPVAPQSEDAVVDLVVAPDALFATVAASLRAQLTRAGITGSECMLAIGDVGASQASYRRVRIAWGGGRPTDGWVLCGADVERAMHDQRLHQVGLLAYRAGVLRVSHPSDTSESSPLDLSNAEVVGLMRSDPALGLFDPEAVDADAQAGAVLSALASSTAAFLFVLCPL